MKALDFKESDGFRQIMAYASAGPVVDGIVAAMRTCQQAISAEARELVAMTTGDKEGSTLTAIASSAHAGNNAEIQ